MADRAHLVPKDMGFKLDAVDLSRSVDAEVYETELRSFKKRLRRIQQAYLKTGNAAVIVFEGWDAAGKGGTIRRMAAVLDPRGFKVWPIGPPRQSELERHYLARFWQRLPPRGGISVFDRSWYGRVLVERVEELAREAEWRRAYNEINQFENQLVDDGVRIVKLFLHISQDEQYRRLEARLRKPTKRWKLSSEDFRNRERWGDYQRAIEDMLQKTSTPYAPWYVVPANSKRFARVSSLKIITDALAHGIDLDPSPLDEEIRAKAEALFGAGAGAEQM